jgi:hypothetical protein
MSWASIGSRGTAQAKTSGADLSFSPTSTVAAGRVLVVCCAWAIDYTRTPEGANWPSVAVHDTKNNLYTQLGGFSFYSFVAIHICQVSSPITTGDTITLHHRNPAHEPKAVTAWEFSKDASLVWARYHDPTANGSGPTTTMTDTIGGVGVQYEFHREVLIIDAWSSMGPETDSYTYDSDYTPMTKAGTTGGGAESNVTVTASFRIATIPNDSIQTTRDVARHTDASTVAIYEATFIPDFPRFPVLDDFNRADEDPLDNSTWMTWLGDGCTAGYGGGELRIAGNEAAKSIVNPWGAGSQWWDDATASFGDYAEVYATVNTYGQAGVILDGTGCGHNATMGGYSAFFAPQSSGYFPDDQLFNGFAGQTGWIGGNGLHTWIDGLDGWGIGLQRTSCPHNFIHAWINRGSGWEWASAWNEIVFGPYNVPGQNKLGLSVWGDNNTRLDDFGGGAEPDCPQFIANMNWRSAGRKGTSTRALKGVQ